MLQKAGNIKNTNVLIFQHIQLLHLMYAEVPWVLVSSGTQVQPQIILGLDYLPDYLSVSYDYGKKHGSAEVFSFSKKIFIKKSMYHSQNKRV